MGRRGAGTVYSSGDVAQDPLQWKASPQETFQAGFREQAQFTLGRQAIDRVMLETEQGGGSKMTIDQANEKYGLDLKPAATNQITEDMAQYLFQKRLQSIMDQAVLEQGGNLPMTFASGFAASATDPLEFGLSALLPFHRLAQTGELSLNAGRLVRPSVASRFLARNPKASLLSNPFVAGVVEGGGGTALVSPLIYNNSNALGREYTFADAMVDVGVSGLVGGVIHSTPHMVRAAMGKKQPVAATAGLPLDPQKADAVAQTSFNTGRPVQVEKTVDRKTAQAQVTKSTQEISDAAAKHEARVQQGLADNKAMVERLRDKVAQKKIPTQTEKFNRRYNLEQMGLKGVKFSRVGQYEQKVGGTFGTAGVAKVLEDLDNELDFPIQVSAAGGADVGHSDGRGGEHKQLNVFDIGFAGMTDAQKVELGNKLAANPLVQDIGITGFEGKFGKQRQLPGHADHVHVRLKPEAAEVDAPKTAKEEAPAKVDEPEAEAEPVQDPVLEPIVFEDPETRRHVTFLEQRLLAATDPETFRTTIGDYVTRLNQNVAKLSELLNLPKSQFLEAAEDARILQSEILDAINQLNEIVPTDQAIVPAFETSKAVGTKGIFTQRAMKALGTEIARLNDLAVRDMDDNSRLDMLRKEHQTLSANLKKALTKVAEGEKKGFKADTLDKWREQVAMLTPQLEHATRLLQAHGENIDTPELSLQHFVDSLGDALPPGLKDLISDSPDLTNEPLYRVRSKIFSNVMSRLNETKDYVENLDLSEAPSSKYAENDKIYAEVMKYLEESGEAADPDGILEKVTQGMEQQIRDAKALGIWSDKELKWFDDLQEKFQADMEQTKAIKDASFQAQLCALRGVEED